MPLCSSAVRGRYLAAICAAPSILGSLGILNGRVATCYPGFEKKLFGAYITTDPVAKDGHVITSRGMGTAIEFASTLIGIIQDPESADKIKASILYSSDAPQIL